MNFEDELFGGGYDDVFVSNEPDPVAYDGQQLVEGYDDDLGMSYVDNSLIVPMDENFEPYNNGIQNDSRDFQTLQPPVSSSYDMDMSHSQSSMGMGGYSNGATNEGLLYEQSTTLSNGDHHMMGGNEEHYGMPSTSFGGYQPSPMAEHQPSPSVSRVQSRPASRSTAPKGGGGGAIAQHLNAPSSSSYSNSPTPTAKPTPTKKSNPPRPANGSRTKKAQGANTVGAVLSKANKLAAAPPTTNTLQLSAEDTQRVAELSMEIARLEKEGTLHARARVDELTKQRAQIFVLALTAQQNVNVDLKALTPSVTTHAPRQRTNQKKQQQQQPPQLPSSPGYTPQCGTMYTPTGHDGYAAVPGPSHGGHMATPSGPQSMHQRGTMYKVTSAGPPHAGPRGLNGVAAAGGGGGVGQAPPLFLQQQQHGQPLPQMVMTSSATTTTTSSSTMMMGRRVGGAGSRTMMVRGGGDVVPQPLQQPLPVQQQPPLQQTHPGLAQHPPGTTVRAALKQGGLQHLQQLNHQQQQPQMQLQQGPMQHRSSPMPSTSTAQQQPQPLLQLSLPVQQQAQPMRMEDPFRPNPQLVARRIEDKRLGRQRKLQNAFDIMSAQLLHPETEVPFSGVDDIFKRLMPYHLLFEHDMDPQLEEEFDLQFMRSMVEADESKRRITERMRKIAFDEAIARKDEERNLLLFLDAEFEKQRLEEERKMSREQPELLHPIVRATALSLSAATPLLPPPSDRLKELKKPDELSTFSLYEYHPFVERRRMPTPPPVGKFHGLEESEEEEDTEDDEKAESVAAAAGPSPASIPASSIKRSPSSDEDEDASPEMGWPADDLPQQAPPPVTVPHHHRPATVPSHHPFTMHDRVVKVEVASPRPAAAAGKVQPTQPIKQEVASPARTKPTVSSRSTVPKFEMPEAIPVPLAKRNRMMQDRMKEEERRKKVEERERKEAEERRGKEDERKERERRKKEEERVRAEENKRREEEERRMKEEMEIRMKEEKERIEREEMEKRKREEGEQKKVILPIKLKIKMAVREEEKKEEEEKKGEEESENREKKSKKKRKKEKRQREENDEDERERKKRKKEKKEHERQATAAQDAAAAAVAVMQAAVPAATATPAIPKLKIKFGGATPAATPAVAAAVAAPRNPVLPVSVPTATPIVRASAAGAPPSTPVQQLQQPQQQSPAPPSSVKLKIRLGGLPPVAAAAATPSPSSKEERRREKEERRKENGHHKEKHHHKHKEHKSEKRHREQQQSQSQPLPPAAAVPQQQPQASSQPTVPSFKLNMTLQRPAPVALPTTPMAVAAAAVMQQQLMNMQQVQQQMAMNTPPQLFRPSVIAAPPQLQMQQLQQSALAAVMGLQQPPPMPLTPVIPPAAPPLIPGLGRLPPGLEEKTPPHIDFSDSEDEDAQRSNSMHESAAAITRMVGHAPAMLPPHHHRLPQLQQIQPAFPWNNQYQ